MKTTIGNIINSKRFILAIRTIGRLYFIVIIINSLFFHYESLYNTPSPSIFIELIAFVLAEYKVDITKMIPRKRSIEILITVTIFMFISYRIMNHSY